MVLRSFRQVALRPIAFERAEFRGEGIRCAALNGFALSIRLLLKSQTNDDIRVALAPSLRYGVQDTIEKSRIIQFVSEVAMSEDTKRRDVIIGVAALIGASAIPNSAFAAGKGYLVRGNKGEYYYFSEAELSAIVQTGKCSATECVLLKPPGRFAKRADASKFELTSAQRIAPQITDKNLIPKLDDKIRRRQELGVEMRAKLIAQGFSLGTMNPTKAG